MSGNYLALTDRDRIEILDAETHECIHVFTGTSTGYQYRKFRSVCFSKNSQFLAADYSGIVVWDMLSKKLIASLGRGSNAYAVSFNHAGDRLLSVDVYGGVDIWDLNNQSKVCTIPRPNKYALMGNQVQYTTDDLWVLIVFDLEPPYRVVAYDANTGVEKATVFESSSFVDVIDVSPTGDIFAVSLYSKSVVIRRLSDEKIKRQFEGLDGCAEVIRFFPDGTKLAMGLFASRRPSSIVVGDVEAETIVATVSCTVMHPDCMSINSDGTKIAWTDRDGNQIVYDLTDDRVLLKMTSSEALNACCYSSRTLLLL
jgi:WD40 repeat protein